MDGNKIRSTFLEFFKSKQHQIVPSAPLVIKNDPTLMFTNAGMNQFKDLFLGNAPVKFSRITDTQKCLRVSGKHNDLEEVGVDTYHHTMFEMLGNWSFGDPARPGADSSDAGGYFKKEAIDWAWELLTKVYKIPVDQLYVTVFEGSKEDKLAFDQEAYDCWKKYIAEDRIINGNKKDNFWEMGDTGPCGPCSEIHVDMRSVEERKKGDGKSLVNTSHPEVIEIWNNVFMEFNRLANGTLQKLPAQHVDTGMGFERLCMVLQGKQSSYDTDVFQPIIKEIEKLSGLTYKAKDTSEEATKTNIAMRVIADHVRAISFSIADGQLPSNTGAGYVIRRILRRAVRYGYQTLKLKEPFICKLVATLVSQMGEAFPEIKKQQELIEKVIREEENSFFKTLATGIEKINAIIASSGSNKVINGKNAFELFDTYGFPIDLTQLIARENNFSVDMDEFNKLLGEQKNRSKEAAAIDTGDWVEVGIPIAIGKKLEAVFIGYTELECESRIIKYRKVKAKNKEQYQLVLDKTPFYAESGGQVGDTGVIEFVNEKIYITDTKKENNLTIHFTDKLPVLDKPLKVSVDKKKRKLTENNHSATHLLHAALRQVLGTHVEQKGSLVNDENLRFDFSHFSKVTDEEIAKIENIVNEKIRENIASDIKEMPIEEAKKTGAMALFGEKYGDVVRVVTFERSYSVELCGGTHVKNTSQIGIFKIVSEAAVAAGIRRIEAITSIKAEEFLNSQLQLVNNLKELLKNPKDLTKSIQNLLEQNNDLQKQVDALMREKAKSLKADLKTKVTSINNINYIGQKVELNSADALKDMVFELRSEIPDLFLVLGSTINGKPSITVALTDNLVKEKNMNAGNIVRELAKEIKGGGGGQAFYATAGGTDINGLDNAIKKAMALLQ